MNEFMIQAAQGDLYISRIEALPATARPVAPVDGRYVVAHSETGHHHVIKAQGCEYFTDEEDATTAYLRVIEASEVVLKHLRSTDTHAPIKVLGGIYRIRRAREWTPEGFRISAD